MGFREIYTLNLFCYLQIDSFVRLYNIIRSLKIIPPGMDWYFLVLTEKTYRILFLQIAILQEEGQVGGGAVSYYLLCKFISKR